MNWSLHKKFSVISFIVILMLGLLLAFGLSNYLKNHILKINALNTSRFSQKHITNQLTANDFQGPLSREKIKNLDGIIKQYIPEGVKRVKIWNPEGVIIYSENKSLIGKKYAIEDELAEALENDRAGTDLTELNKDENIDDTELKGKHLEIYVPVEINNKVVGALEFYLDSNLMQDGVEEAQYQVWLAVTTALLVLYVTLYQLVKQGSETIEAQEQALVELDSKLDQVTELTS